MNPNTISIRNFPEVTIVVIGLNEADNLAKTFRAIQQVKYPPNLIEVIYVDSGSTDDSLSIARDYCDKCFVENVHPSAGRNRNRGLTEAKHDIVHFIDGDMAVDSNYLIKAVSILKDKDVQAVVGQLEEQSKGIWNRLATLVSNDLKRDEGYTDFTSTGATYVRTALLSIDGYDERILRGQEIELGVRFKQAGYKIWSTLQVMGQHNYGNSSLYHYLLRFRANAKSLVQVAVLQGENSYFKKARKRLYKSLIRFVVLIVVGGCLLIKEYYLAFSLFYLAMVLYSSRSMMCKKNPTPLIALAIASRLIGEVFFYWGLFEELGRYLFASDSRGFYSLEKELLHCGTDEPRSD